MQPPRSFAEFWPHYVLAHRHPLTRAFHFTGTLLAWTLLIAAIARRSAFDHPLWSWLADQKMVGLMLSGRMGEEVRRCAEKA